MHLDSWHSFNHWLPSCYIRNISREVCACCMLWGICLNNFVTENCGKLKNFSKDILPIQTNYHRVQWTMQLKIILAREKFLSNKLLSDINRMPNQKMIKIDPSHQCCIRCARDIRLLGYQDKNVLYMQDNNLNMS